MYVDLIYMGVTHQFDPLVTREDGVFVSSVSVTGGYDEENP